MSRTRITQADGSEGDLMVCYPVEPLPELATRHRCQPECQHQLPGQLPSTDDHREYAIVPATLSATALEATSFGLTLAHKPPWAVIGLALLIILATAAEWWSRRVGRPPPPCS